MPEERIRACFLPASSSTLGDAGRDRGQSGRCRVGQKRAVHRDRQFVFLVTGLDSSASKVPRTSRHVGHSAGCNLGPFSREWQLSPKALVQVLQFMGTIW